MNNDNLDHEDIPIEEVHELKNQIRDMMMEVTNTQIGTHDGAYVLTLLQNANVIFYFI